MDEELEHIKKHIDECYAHIRQIISLRDLYECKRYIMGEEMLIPFLREDLSSQLESIRQRVKALTDLMEAEETRTERERIKGGTKK